MGLFSFFGKNIVRPYSKAFDDVGSSVRGIKNSIDQLQELKEKESNVEYIEAKDGKEAFKVLYERGGWTPEDIANQKVAVRRAKWVFMACTVLSIILFFTLGMTSSNVFFTLVSTGFSALSTALFGVRCLQYSIFQTQLDESNLISFGEFMSRKDFWKRIFS